MLHFCQLDELIRMRLKPLFNSQVEYQCKGFLEKNRDTLYEELVDIMRASKVQTVTCPRLCVFITRILCLKEKHFVLSTSNKYQFNKVM